MTGVGSFLLLGQIEKWDQWLFKLLNSRWTNPLFDALLPYLRDSVFWAPLYVFILAFITLNWGRKGLWWSLLFLCTVALADLIGARIFKEGFERLRPCQDPCFQMEVRLLLKHCSGSYSFVSNHAANHFGIATFISVTFFSLFRRWIFLAYLWAAIISYAQVYVGVHYPLDVAGGAALGTACGVLMAYLFKRKWGSFTPFTNLNP